MSVSTARIVTAIKSSRGIIYKYQHSTRECGIPSLMLNSILRTWGCPIDPILKDGSMLSPECVIALHQLAQKVEDFSLVATLTAIQTRPPSLPVESHLDEKLTHQTQLEIQRYQDLTWDQRKQVHRGIEKILHLGLLFGGWDLHKNMPYPTKLYPVPDVIRMELDSLAHLQSIPVDPAYAFIQSFPIIRSKDGRFEISDRVLHSCLEPLWQGAGYELIPTAIDLIVTSYYYITVIEKIPLPMLKPLLTSIDSTS